MPTTDAEPLMTALPRVQTHPSAPDLDGAGSAVAGRRPRQLPQLRLAAPAPAWQLAVADALQAASAASARAPHAPVAAAALQLALCEEGAQQLSGAGRHWLLMDGQGRQLHTHYPLWDAASRGQGLALQLWERAQPGADWQLVRMAHAGADARPGRALAQLSTVAARLVVQALADQAQGQGTRVKAPHAPGPAPEPQVWQGMARGQWCAWRSKWQALSRTEAWRIGIVDAPVGQWLQAPHRLPVHWLDQRASWRYEADPMGVPGNPDVLLCETFDERSGLGFIERLTLGADRQVARRERLPLDQGRHVSFPLMVEIDGERYGLLESASHNNCVLYRVDADGGWHRLATLLSGQPVADPALFRHGGHWWLAATDQRIGAQDNLCLYHAVRPEGPWLPHANNPVKLDIGSARMAGPVFRLPVGDGAQPEDTMLVRPGQDCLGGYGRAVVLHRITELSPTRFSEERIQRIGPAALAPEAGLRLDGVHTVCPWGERTLIDAKRHVVNRWTLLRKLRQRWRRVLRLAPRDGA